MKRTRERNTYVTKMQILMDFASIANYYSFEEIENDISVLNKDF